MSYGEHQAQQKRSLHPTNECVEEIFLRVVLEKKPYPTVINRRDILEHHLLVMIWFDPI